MMTPALAIDGEVKLVGKVASPEENPETTSVEQVLANLQPRVSFADKTVNQRKEFRYGIACHTSLVLGYVGSRLRLRSCSRNSTEAGAAEAKGRIKIVAVACSPRRGKTTAQALQIALDAAKKVAPDKVEVELIELAGLKIPGELAAGIPLEEGQHDDFPMVAGKLSDPAVAAILIGTPVYFANMTSLCKAFIDRCGVFRKNNFALVRQDRRRGGGGRPVGAAGRNWSSKRSTPHSSAMKCLSSATGDRRAISEPVCGTTATTTSVRMNLECRPRRTSAGTQPKLLLPTPRRRKKTVPA